MNNRHPRSAPVADSNPTRRRFLRTTAAGCLALSLPWRRTVAGENPPEDGAPFDVLSRDLLRDWCDGLLALQIDAPSDPARHGALAYPACDFIHGRCMDAVYPFLHMARVTGQEKCIKAGVAVFEWSKNVSQEDGSWTVKPCVHHTFTHAKALAAIRDHGDLARRIRPGAPPPRAAADGIRAYPEIATWLAARGPWRATVTVGDWIYGERVQQPTGGSLSLLWHQQVGPLLAGSMARYELVEKNNMQVNPDPGDHPLTLRVELWEDGAWFTQLYDLAAEATPSDEAGVIDFVVVANLLNASRQKPARGHPKCSLVYRFDKDTALIAARMTGNDAGTDRLRPVLPLVSPVGEKASLAAGRIEIRKPEGVAVIEADAPLRIEATARSRIFNLVPGFEAVPIVADIPADGWLECRLTVMPS